jgi:hypothetical protein
LTSRDTVRWSAKASRSATASAERDRLGWRATASADGTHRVSVVGMFFFDDNCFVLRRGDPVGERLAQVAKAQNILVMMCDMCALERNLAEGQARWCDASGKGLPTPRDCRVKDTVEGVTVGCFPDLYEALGGNPPDLVISL